MLPPQLKKQRKRVALLTEGVDRNRANGKKIQVAESRPPHGGRG